MNTAPSVPSTKLGCLVVAIAAIVFLSIAAINVRGATANFFGFSSFLIAIVGGIGWPIYVATQKSKHRAYFERQFAQEVTKLDTTLHAPQVAPQKQSQKDVPLQKATRLGKQVQTETDVVVQDADRQSGMYALGVQGVGKSSLLEQLIYQDIVKGYSVIVLDPHGDVIDHVMAQMPQERVKDIFVLDIEDTEYPFGLNLLTVPQGASEIEKQRAHDRMLHVFEKCFPDTSHMLLEKYLGNIAPVFFARPGYTIAEIPKFLRDDTFRDQLVKNKGVRFFVREFWENDYGSMSVSRRQTETASLATRLNRFVRSPIVGNIIGQSSTTIDFRRAIEQKEIILIRLPIKTLPEDAAFIGTMLIAQIHAAIFSFGDLPLEKRPGFSLFVDEFQHFATSDFAEMFTEGRKFGSRVTVAHQFREQIPDFLASATLTARSIITFQTTQQDAGKMASLFLQRVERVRQEDMMPDVAKQLLQVGHPNPTVEKFIKVYLRPLQMMVKAQMIEVTTWQQSSGQAVWNAWQTPKPSVRNPMPLVSPLLYEAEVKNDWKLPLSGEIIYGFSNCGNGYHNVLDHLRPQTLQYLTTYQAVSSPESIKQTRERLPGQSEQVNQLMDFLITIRTVMQVLAANPLGEKKQESPSEVAQKILKLPRRHALVKIGTAIHEIKTVDTPRAISADERNKRKYVIVGQTRAKYCKPRALVEEEIEHRQQSSHAFSQESSKTTAPASIICPQCGTEQTNTRFCSSCGQSLATSTKEQAQPRKRFSEDEA